MPEQPQQQEAPETLPADFFAQKNTGQAPDALPADFFSKQGALHAKGSPTLPENLPERMGETALQAIPYIAGTAAGVATGGAGFVPEVLAAAGGGGLGSLVEQGVRKLTGTNPPKNVRELGSRVGTATAENAVAEFGGKALTGALEKTIGKWMNPERLYQSALQPTGASQAKAAKAVKAGLDEGIVLDRGAADKASAGAKALNKKIESIIGSKPANIPAAAWQRNVQSQMDALRQKWGRVAGKGADYIKQIDSFERDFLVQEGNVQPITKQVTAHQPSKVVGPNGQPIQVPVTKTVTVQPQDMSLAELRSNARAMPAQSAQRIKKSTYEGAVSSRSTVYDQNVHPALQLRMQKEVARSLKEELEGIYPQIKNLNEREGSLIQLEKELDGFVKREMNKPGKHFVMGGSVGGAIGGALGYTGGGAVGAGEGAAGGAAAGGMAEMLIRRVVSDPAIKSRLAIALQRAGKLPGKKIIMKAAKEAPSAAIRTGEYALQDSE